MRLRTLFVTGFFLAALLPACALAWLNYSPMFDWGVAMNQFASRNIWYIAGMFLVSIFCIILLSSIVLKRAVKPIELAVIELNKNAESQHMAPIDVLQGRGIIREFQELQDTYNLMVRRMMKSSAQLKRLAYVDGVTNLPNREKFQDTLQRVVSDERMLAKGGAVIFVDMDNFKEINDLHGHDIGDQFLQSVAKSLSLSAYRYYESVRTKGDGALNEPVVSRIGGDEFTLLVPGLTDELALTSFLETLRKSILEPTSELNFLSDFGASIGCARYPNDGTTVQELFKRSDIAMYHAKALGKNRAIIFEPEIGTQSEAELRRDVLLAIENNELFLEYQPKVYARDRTIAGVEALVRWNHPSGKVLAPNDWLPAISNSHVIVKLGNWVLERAMRDHANWVAKGFDLRLSVNIGAKHFIAPEFISKLTELSRKFEFNHSLLEIEVSEDVLFGSGRSAADVLARLRDFGYTVSIDDFGKGYSNLARLAELQVDYIKLDRSLVTRAQKDTRVRSILSASITLANELGCQTIAEGVESIREVDFITHMGADMLQGYYFSKSMPASQVVPWLQMLGENIVHQQQAQLTQAIA
jgi:diguanylate cyclase (GGDEF)-like protein